MNECKMMKIRDALASVHQKVSFFGVIVEIGLPKKSKGIDYYCTMRIADESHPNPGVSVTFFTKYVNQLPRASSAGDIIQLCDVKILSRNREAFANYNKHFSSFALYGGEDGEKYTPYQISQNFCYQDLHKEIVAGLRKWVVDVKPGEGSINFLPLREIKEGELMNMACKVLHCCKDAQDVWMVFLWDGTDTPPCSIHAPLEDEMDNPLPLHHLPLPRDLLCTFPTVGTILRVTIDGDIQKHFLHLLNPGQWMNFFNVLFKVTDGSWCGVLTLETRLRYMFIEDEILKKSQRLYESRLSMTMGRMPYSCFPKPSAITDVDCDGRVPCRTLMDVLTHSEVKAKFKCVVRVVAALPWRVEDFVSPVGTYRVRLTLEDPTARIHAFIYAEDGEYFFDGYPATDVLSMKWKKLLGVAVGNDGEEIRDASRNPPWFLCCLKSHHRNENNRHYRIFGTKQLLG